MQISNAAKVLQAFHKIGFAPDNQRLIRNTIRVNQHVVKTTHRFTVAAKS